MTTGEEEEEEDDREEEEGMEVRRGANCIITGIGNAEERGGAACV
jgi:hypothetical protein